MRNPCSILPSWSVWSASKFLKGFCRISDPCRILILRLELSWYFIHLPIRNWYKVNWGNEHYTESAAVRLNRGYLQLRWPSTQTFFWGSSRVPDAWGTPQNICVGGYSWGSFVRLAFVVFSISIFLSVIHTCASSFSCLIWLSASRNLLVAQTLSSAACSLSVSQFRLELPSFWLTTPEVFRLCSTCTHGTLPFFSILFVLTNSDQSSPFVNGWKDCMSCHG